MNRRLSNLLLIGLMLIGLLTPIVVVAGWTDLFSSWFGRRPNYSRSVGREPPASTLQEESTKFQRELKLAVVAGINAYPDGSGLRPLRYARADAEALAAALTKAGYGVQLFTDAQVTRGTMLQAIHRIGQLLDPNQGTALFAFSGHGFRDKQGNNYLAPYESFASDIGDTGLAVKKIEQAMVKSGARRRILLIDACRDDPDPGGRTSQKGASFSRYSLFQEAAGTQILFSTHPGGLSWEHPDLKHGIFTHFVLKGLQGAAANSQGLITFRSLSDYVQMQVPKWAIQKRWVQKPYNAGEKRGWFLLAGHASSVQSPTQLPQQAQVNTKLQAEQERLAALRKQRQAEEARLQQLELQRQQELERQRQAAAEAARLDETKKAKPVMISNRYQLNGDGTVTDLRTGLMWKRCSEGQIWTGYTCEGKANKMRWDNAMPNGRQKSWPIFAGYDDWKLPTKEQLRTLVWCSNGVNQKMAWRKSCNGKGVRVRNVNYRHPTIDTVAFPNAPAEGFWTSSAYNPDLADAWAVGFDHGYAEWHGRSSNGRVRLFRVQ